MKCLCLLILFLGLTSANEIPAHEELQCNIKTCGTDLLNFSEMNFGVFIKKVKTAIFCIRQCSPPQVHEFFQSITFAITKRIPGICSGKDCINANRFVALGQCLQNRSFPLIQCGSKLIDLSQLALDPVAPEERVNKTCSIIIGTLQCLEENMQKCGHNVFDLVREIFGDVVKLGMNVYCQPHYSHASQSLLATANPTSVNHIMDIPNLKMHAKPLKHVAKGYKHTNGDVRIASSFFTVFATSLGLLLIILV